MNTEIFDAVFWSFFITSMIGLILKCGSMAYKSKCTEVQVCCMKIVRDVEAEEKETEFRLSHRIPSTPNMNENNEN
jgi:hypothetical protein